MGYRRLTYHLSGKLRLCYAETVPEALPGSHDAQTVVQLERGRAQVDRVIAAGNGRVATVNNIPDPTDILMAQYSIPFCVFCSVPRPA